MGWTKLLVVLAFVAVAAGHTNAQPAAADPRCSYHVGSQMTVTIKKGAEELATINFPRGVHVAVSDGTPAQARRCGQVVTISIKVPLKCMPSFQPTFNRVACPPFERVQESSP